MVEPIPVSVLFEAHLTVSDLTRSVAFYRDVVGLELASEAPEIGAAFFWIGGPGDAMLGLWTTGSAPVGLSLHIAFKTSLGHVLGSTRRLRALGVTPLSFASPSRAGNGNIVIRARRIIRPSHRERQRCAPSTARRKRIHLSPTEISRIIAHGSHRKSADPRLHFRHLAEFHQHRIGESRRRSRTLNGDGVLSHRKADQ